MIVLAWNFFDYIVDKNKSLIEKAMRIGQDNHLVPVNLESMCLPSNNLSDSYFETGDFVIYDEHGVFQNSPYSSKRGFLLPRWMSIDIDDQEDWEMAEMFLINQK